jgi:hypothetical protein
MTIPESARAEIAQLEQQIKSVFVPLAEHSDQCLWRMQVDEHNALLLRVGSASEDELLWALSCIWMGFVHHRVYGQSSPLTAHAALLRAIEDDLNEEIINTKRRLALLRGEQIA